MVVLVQFGRLAFVAVAMLVRWIVSKLEQTGKGAWVTGRTGNVTVVTDRLF